MTNLSNLTKAMIERAQALGADVVKASASLSEVREFNVDGGKFSLFRTLFNRSASITVFKGGKKGAASINRFDDESIEGLIRDALAAADSAQPDEAWDLCHEAYEYDITDGAPECDVETLFARTKELKDTINQDYPKVLIEQMIVDHTGCDSVYADTSDNLYTDESGSYNVSLMFSGHEGEKASS